MRQPWTPHTRRNFQGWLPARSAERRHAATIPGYRAHRTMMVMSNQPKQRPVLSMALPIAAGIGLAIADHVLLGISEGGNTTANVAYLCLKLVEGLAMIVFLIGEANRYVHKQRAAHN